MAKHRDILVPRTTVNDDVVEVSAWLVEHGENVTQGTPLCTIETSKSAVEITAECDGYVSISVGAGQRIPIHEAIGALTSIPAAAPTATRSPTPHVHSQSDEITATRKARELAERLGIDLGVIESSGIVRERDVRAYFEAHNPGRNDSVESARPAPDAMVSPPSAADRQRVLRTALRPALDGLMWLLTRIPGIRSLTEAVVRNYPTGIVGSALRTSFYAHRVRRMGRHVTIETGALIEGADSIEIGDSVHIDSNAKLVGGGYGQPLKIGNHVHVGPGVIIFGAGGVTIGDYVAIAAGSAVYSARSLPEDPARPGELISMSHAAPDGEKFIVREPVVIGEYAFVGLHVSILPGVTVGQGSIVNTGAVVANDVPPFSIVGGSTSTVVGRRAVKPRPAGS